MRKTLIILWIIITFVATSFSAQVLLNLDDGDTVNGDTFDTIDDNFTELYGFTDGTTPLTNATGLPLTTGVTGLLPLANGGLAYDYSAVTGGLGVTGGATTLINSAATLELVVGLGTIFNSYADDDTYADFRTTIGVGLTSEDPDATATGQFTHDTDGANVDNDYIIRSFDGTNQFPVAQKLVWLTFPFTTSGAVTNWQPWANETGMTFTFTRIFCRSDTDDLGITIDEFTSLENLTNLNEIVDVTVATDGTNVYHDTTLAADGDVTDTEIETNHGISFDIDAAAEGYVQIEGWFDADVN